MSESSKSKAKKSKIIFFESTSGKTFLVVLEVCVIVLGWWLNNRTVSTTYDKIQSKYEELIKEKAELEVKVSETKKDLDSKITDLIKQVGVLESSIKK